MTRGTAMRNNIFMPTLVFLAAFPAFPIVVFGADAVQFDRETYSKKFTSSAPDIRLAEYVRSKETLKNWTRLVAVRNFMKLNDPKSAAIELAKAVKRQNPRAQFQILTKDDGSEAQIDFLILAGDSDYLEFNIHRYLKVAGNPGLISYQFAHRVTDKSPQAMETFKTNRQRWINELSKASFEIDFNQQIGGYSDQY